MDINERHIFRFSFGKEYNTGSGFQKTMLAWDMYGSNVEDAAHELARLLNEVIVEIEQTYPVKVDVLNLPMAPVVSTDEHPAVSSHAGPAVCNDEKCKAKYQHIAHGPKGRIK